MGLFRKSAEELKKELKKYRDEIVGLLQSVQISERKIEDPRYANEYESLCADMHRDYVKIRSKAGKASRRATALTRKRK